MNAAAAKFEAPAEIKAAVAAPAEPAPAEPAPAAATISVTSFI